MCDRVLTLVKELKFLIIDNKDDRERTIRQLKKDFPDAVFLEITGHGDFEEALSKDDFDIVLTDYSLPWADGLQVLKEVKSRTRDKPVVMLTSAGNEEVVAEGMKLGLDDYVLKKNLPLLPAVVKENFEKVRIRQEYKDAAHQLMASEERFRRLVELSPDGLFVHSKGKVFYANAAGISMIGARSADELVGRNILDFIHPDYHDIVKDRIERLERGEETGSLEERFVRLDGIVIDVEVASTPIIYQDEPAILSVARDITERKHTAEEIIESRRQVLDILESISDAFFALDSLWRFTYVNRRAEQILGKRKEELLYKNIWEVLPEAVDSTFQKMFYKAIAKQTPISFEEFYPPFDKWFEVHAYPYRLGLSVYFTDITERKNNEVALQRYKLLFKHSRDILLFVRRKDGRIIEANEAALNAYGYAREELLSRTIYDLRAEETLPQTDKQMATASEKGILFETAHRRKDGSTFPVEVSSQSAVINGEEILLSVIRDITERKRFEDALKESERRFREMLEKARLVAVTVDLTGKVTFINDFSLRLTGWSRNEMVGKDFEIFIPPEQREEVKRMFFEAVTKGEVRPRYESDIVTRSGERRTISFTNVLLRDARGNIAGTANIGEDITERKRLFEQVQHERREVEQLAKMLRKERDTLEVIMESTNAHIAYLDRDFNFVLVNSTYERGSGHTRDELIGRNHFELFPNPENEMIFKKVRDTGEPVEYKAKPFEFADQPWRGTTYWDWTLLPVKDASGRVVGLVLSLVDVTESIRARQLSDALNDINAAVGSTLDFNEIMRRVVTKSAKAIGSETASVVLRIDDRWLVKYVYNMPQELMGKSLTDEDLPHAAHVARTREIFIVNDVATDPRINREKLNAFGIRSFMMLPLTLKDDFIGVLVFGYHSETVPFTNQQIDFAHKLAASVSLALENARLFNAEVEASKQAGYVLDISNHLLEAADTLALSINLNEVVEHLADIIIEVTGRSRIAVLLLDKRTDELISMVSRGEPKIPAGTRFKLGHLAPQLQQSIREEKIVIVDYEAPGMPEESKKRAEAIGARLILSVPLVFQDQVIGHIGLDEPGERRDFTGRDIELVKGIASQAAVVIENARLHEKSVARARTFEAVAQMGSIVTSTLSLRDTVNQIADYASLLLGIPSSLLLTFDREARMFRVAAGQKVSEKLRKESLELGEVRALGFDRGLPSVVDDLDMLSKIRFFSTAADEGFVSAIVSPLFVDADLRGLIMVQDKKPLTPTEEELAALRLFASQAASAIRNAERYEAERNIADTLQNSLLTLPRNIPGIDFGYIYRSATEAAKVGGDFYDVFEIEHGKVGIIIGDVSGKGIEAAALTTVVRNTIKAHAYEGGTPAIVMSKTNDTVTKTSSPHDFVTVFFGILDTKTGRLSYCSAGHPPAIIKRKGGGVDLLAKHSPMIGAFTKMHYRSGKESLNKGDILIAYTDGLIEARNNGGFFGEGGLIDFVVSLEATPAEKITQAIFERVMEFTGGRLSDDLALVSVGLKEDVDA